MLFYHAENEHAHAGVTGADFYPAPFTAVVRVTSRESCDQRSDKKVQVAGQNQFIRSVERKGGMNY